MGPIEGFKKYDLDVYEKYAVIKQNRTDIGYHQEIYGNYWRRGKNKPGDQSTYTSTPNRFPRNYYPKDYDDSYFINSIHYNNVAFTSSISSSSQIIFSSVTSSYISSPHDEKFNFDKDEDFAISFWMEPQATGSDGGFNSEEKRYLISKSTTKTISPQSSSINQTSVPESYHHD